MEFHDEKEEAYSSSTTSQSQEFSFTVSLHSDHAETTNSPNSASPGHTTSSPSPISSAIDLSPAGEIFFHGHLLPLHLLSHFSLLPSSARSSLDDTFTLPPDRYLQSIESTHPPPSKSCNMDNSSSQEKGIRYKSTKAFSMFGLSRRRRVHGVRDNLADDGEIEQKRRNSKFEVNNALKRCMRMLMNPLLLFRGRRRSDIEFCPQENSFSRNLGRRRNFKTEQAAKRRPTNYSAYYSAPVSGTTSPTYSGLLVERPILSAHAVVNDSTVEELQAAIQAAIAHCKRSIEV